MKSSNISYTIEDVEFNAEGTLLRGWLYRPTSNATPLPAIVMAHGLKNIYTHNPWDTIQLKLLLLSYFANDTISA